MTINASFEHLTMIGCEDYPTILQQAGCLQIIIESIKLLIAIQDEFIIFCAGFCLTFFHPASQDFGRLLYEFEPIVLEGIKELIFSSIRMMRREKMKISDKGLGNLGE